MESKKDREVKQNKSTSSSVSLMYVVLFLVAFGFVIFTKVDLNRKHMVNEHALDQGTFVEDEETPEAPVPYTHPRKIGNGLREGSLADLFSAG